VSASPAKRLGARRRLPRGRHGLPRELVVSNQRERIIDALASVCGAKGYRATTVEDVIAEAGVSRRTFYDLFAGKQQCFLVAYEVAMERVLEAVERAFSSGDGAWSERMARALQALLSLLAAEPNCARLVMVEVLAAGRPALECRDAALSRFAVLFDEIGAGLPLTARDRELLARAVIGGLAEALYSRIATGEIERLVKAGPELLYCMLVPYVGHKQALAASAAWPPSEARIT
jgi:AcrR family transcriptional regulator